MLSSAILTFFCLFVTNIRTESEISVQLVALFEDLFQNSPRFDSSDRARVQWKIYDKLQQYGLLNVSQIQMQKFSDELDPSVLEGANVIAHFDGKDADTESEQILVVAAHVDTVAKSPGYNDGGSGVIALLELARRVNAVEKRMRPCTLIFAFVDLHHRGLLGSYRFIQHHLLPELKKKKLRSNKQFLGAYILDSILIFDDVNGSQSFAPDFETLFKENVANISQKGSKGDFLTVWLRKNVDENLSNRFLEYAYKPQYTIEKLTFNLSSSSLMKQIEKNRVFLASDHINFWWPPDKSFADTFSAVQLSDLGLWRKSYKNCYHQPCDDRTLLSVKNVDFLRNTIDALFKVVTGNYTLPPSTPKPPSFGLHSPIHGHPAGLLLCLSIFFPFIASLFSPF